MECLTQIVTLLLDTEWFTDISVVGVNFLSQSCCFFFTKTTINAEIKVSNVTSYHVVDDGHTELPGLHRSREVTMIKWSYYFYHQTR